jgi:hypothetical protein
MLTRENKIGLVLAFLLALSDVAFLGALSEDDSSDRPPVWVVAVSVVVGVVSIVLVVLAWRSPAWPLMIAIIGLRVLSGLGDFPGFTQDATVVTLSAIHLAVTVVCIALLRNWIRRPVEQHSAAAVG